MFKEFIEKILILKNPEIINVNGRKLVKQGDNYIFPDEIYLSGRTFFHNKNYEEIKQKEHEIMILNSLTGLIEFIKICESNDHKFINKKESLIRITHYNEIILSSKKYNDNLSFETFVGCHSFKDCQFPFGKFISQEDFAIKLMTFFDNNKAKEDLLSIISCVQSDHLIISEDDGISQEVTTKRGISFKDDVKLPLYLKLLPFRTFPELQTIDEIFILRLRKAGSGEIEFALFETGSLTWQLELMKNIHEYLLTRLEDWDIIK